MILFCFYKNIFQFISVGFVCSFIVSCLVSDAFMIQAVFMSNRNFQMIRKLGFSIMVFKPDLSFGPIMLSFDVTFVESKFAVKIFQDVIMSVSL